MKRSVPIPVLAFPWSPGARYLIRSEVSGEIHGSGRLSEENQRIPQGLEEFEVVPDLEDRATQGILLAALKAELGDARVHAEPYYEGWAVIAPPVVGAEGLAGRLGSILGDGPDYAAALVDAWQRHAEKEQGRV